MVTFTKGPNAENISLQWRRLVKNMMATFTNNRRVSNEMHMEQIFSEFLYENFPQKSFISTGCHGDYTIYKRQNEYNFGLEIYSNLS